METYAQNQNSRFNEKFTPILSMFLFTSSIVCRKISTWVLLGIFSAIILVVGLLPVILVNSLDGSIYDSLKNDVLKIYISMTLLINGILITLFSGIQGVITGLTIFKDTQKDGIEILVLSKPITRMQILIARFAFLLLFVICLALIYMILVVIGCGALGFKYIDFYADQAVVIGGTFGAVILSFMIMAVIAIAISLKLSSKASTAIPIVILSFSAMIGILTNCLAGIFIKGPEFSIDDQITNNVKKQLVGRTFTETNNSGYGPSNPSNPSNPNEPQQPQPINRIVKSVSLNANDYWNSIYLDYTMSNDYCFASFVPYTYSSTISWSFTVDFEDNNGSVFVYYSSYQNSNGQSIESEISLAIYEIIYNTLKTASASANGFTALNYLNPISAFTTMCGANNSSAIFNRNSIPYNFSIDKYIEWGNYSGQYRVDITQRDPAWGLFLMWLGIMAGLVTLIIFDYKRKDFK